jgi:coproporphyrinogen III oxidase
VTQATQVEALRERAASLFMALQEHISRSLEALEPNVRFAQDIWERSDIRGGEGGGGITRILANGGVFEKAGVNFSKVYGHVSADFAEKLGAAKEELPFFATGVSLVIHPRSPMIPTTHANWRYLELGDRAWFGGGSDLTPYYLEDEDAIHFHTVLKDVCDKHGKDYYPRFKEWCDRYFYLPHRGETRGIGGIFFDHLGRDDGADHEALLKFVHDLGFAFTAQYLPIVQRRKGTPYGEREREFQLVRRGRYVEFNLLYDRGTHFGLQTGGRTESILMSLPPVVRWEYCAEVTPGSREEYLIERLRKVRDWANH